MRSSALLALAASLSTSAAVYQGFNYGATNSDGSFKVESTYFDEFTTAKNLVGTSGFSSARLYTMIQGGSYTNEPTSAIPAAINTTTSLLLGLWASGGQGGIEAEITALKSAISTYGTDFTKLVVGISVGSEDLYRVSPIGIAAKSGYGADPDTIVSYISQVRSAIANTGLSGVPVGHVDTWTAWVNGSNSAVATACDWIGMDAYPYFQDTMSNAIASGASLFNEALANTKAAVGGKPVWITETGWPVSGSTRNLAVPSLANAKTYWDAVACPLLGTVNTWWFTLQDAAPTTPDPSFGIVGSTLSNTPLYDLSCSDVSSSSSSSAAATSSTSSSAAASSSGASSVSSAVSSVSSATTATSSAIATGGLTPNNGNGIGSSSGSGPAPTSITSSGSSGASGNDTVSTATLTKTTSKASGTGSSSTGTTTSPATVSGNSAASTAGSLAGVIGAALAVMAAL